MDFLSNLYQVFATASHAAQPSTNLDMILHILKGIIALVGTLVILIGVFVSAYQFAYLKFFHEKSRKKGWSIEVIRRNLGLTIVLGLEFIIAADVVSTISAPDYYSVGILAIVVVIRTFLSYSLSREISELPAEQKSKIKKEL